VAKFAVIMPAAGASRRFFDKNYKKPFISLDGRAVWIHAAEKFLSRDDVVQLILVISPQDREEFNMRFAANVAIMGVDVVDGGAERADSVQQALGHVKPEADYVAVHDAARPCIAEEWIETIFSEAEKTGAAIFATPVAGTLKKASDKTIDETVSRQDMWEAQTPQVFRRQVLLDAYAQRDGFNATDDAQLVERTGTAVAIVTGSSLNRKITTKEDLKLATQILKILPKPKPGGTGNPFADAGDIF